ncbi:four helix bundle protein [Oceanihabitans sp. 2_MG-2023]|uniref:four helix bundle protein n=1 Tax=Oceanihabitans sp. 2_MG-2023 TaxID=3062661 RepID=UPI0026E35C74|nr:four helix bundle protein [Oceanihabitans sp. 2_MG-2023]MDO6597302.1 four helix bundle protein [Oceanihabitans sp. 2_MG-2023]
MKSYRDLIVWQKAVDIGTLTYKLLNNFPEDEKFGLTSQIKRSSISISSNIARGSLLEMQTQLQIANHLSFFKLDDLNVINDLSLQIGKMLNSLIKK